MAKAKTVRSVASEENSSEHDQLEESASLVIYDRLLQDLFNGTFLMGSPLLETVLTQRYKVSRTPIREALARLEQDGLVERAPRGFRVRNGTAADILEIYESRIVLEELAAEYASLRRTELELARLRRIHEESKTTESSETFAALNSQFHREIWSAAHNNTVITLLNRLSYQLRVFDRGHRDPGDVSLTLAEHERIVEAIATRNAIAAKKETSEHLLRTREVRIQQFAAQDLGY